MTPPGAKLMTPPGAKLMTQYYKLMSHRATIFEYWRLANSLSEFTTFMRMKFMLPPLPLGTGIGRPDALDRLQADELPAHARRALDRGQADFEALGFRMGFYYTIPMLGAQEGYVLALLGQDPRVAAATVYARQRNDVVEFEQTTCSFATERSDGNVLSTVNSKRTFNAPPGVIPQNYPGISSEQLLEHHQQRIASLPLSQTRPLTNDQELDAFSLKMNHVEIDDFIRRGLYEPLADDEVAEQTVAHQQFLRQTRA